MRKLIVTYILIVGYGLGVYWIGIHLGSKRVIIHHAGTIPSLVQIQKMIGATPDGIYGAETKALWERALCNQAAAKHDDMYDCGVEPQIGKAK